MTGYDSFYESAALLDLSARGRIIATGDDRQRLLHALTTNQIEKLSPGQGVYAFFLNAQGRVLADAIVICRETDLLISVEPEAREKIYSHIDRHIIADDVTLADVTSSTFELALEGPQSASILASLGVPLPTDPYSFTNWNGTTVVLASATGAPGFRLIAPGDQRLALRASLLSAGAIDASPRDREIVALEHGEPRYGVDFTESHIAQETGLTRALNFNKGCYLGQEIVERVRSRGHVNRLLTALVIDSQTAPSPGAKLTAAGAEVGEITSAAFSPRQGVVRALAYVRTATLTSAAPMDVEGALAKPIQEV
jgi:tRNA-modifying protein YgfZ